MLLFNCCCCQQLYSLVTVYPCIASVTAAMFKLNTIPFTELPDSSANRHSTRRPWERAAEPRRGVRSVEMANHLDDVRAWTAGQPFDEETARALTIAALDDTELRHKTVCALVQVLADSHNDVATGVAAMGLLFALSVSVSGAEVRARAASSDTAPPVGVLILGPTGGSVSALASWESFYAKQHPDWRIVRSVGVGVSPNVYKAASPVWDVATRRIIDALAGCERILVHNCSNGGHAFYVRSVLELGADSLRERVAGVIYDCAPCFATDFTDEHLYEILMKTVAAGIAAAGTEAKRGPRAGPHAGSGFEATKARMDAAAKAIVNPPPPNAEGVAKAKCVQDTEIGCTPIVTSDYANSPPVASLFLTSDEDMVLPRVGVENFARALKGAQPSRPITVEVLKGKHCELLFSDSAAYTAAIEKIAEAALHFEPKKEKMIVYDPDLDEPMSMEAIVELQDELLADDVELKEEMATWTRRRIMHYLESGGDDKKTLQTNVLIPGAF